MSETAVLLREYRLRRAWSQEQLADIAGVSPRTVQRLEQGRPAALETLKALAAVLEVDVSLLRGGAPTLADKDDSMTDAAPARDSSHSLRRHLLIFAGVMAGLTALNLINNPGHLWVLYPAVGWGVPLAIKALSLRRTPPPSAA